MSEAALKLWAAILISAALGVALAGSGPLPSGKALFAALLAIGGILLFHAGDTVRRRALFAEYAQASQDAAVEAFKLEHDKVAAARLMGRASAHLEDAVKLYD